jgi:MFS family permease
VRSLGLVGFFADLSSEIACLLFAIGDSSDMFILLKANSLVAPSASEVVRLSVPVLLYVLYNAVYAAASTPLGGLSDRVGQYPLVIGGYLVFAAVYAGFAAAGSWLVLAGLFAAYGLYIAATEGTSKALISRAVPQGEARGSALGLYYTATGLASFSASTIGGLLWSAVGPGATFAFGAAAALVAAAVMLLGRDKVRRALGT